MNRIQLKQLVATRLVVRCAARTLELTPRAVGENVSEKLIADEVAGKGKLRVLPNSLLDVVADVIVDSIPSTPEGDVDVSEDSVNELIENDPFVRDAVDEISAEMGRLTQVAYSTLKDRVAMSVETLVDNILSNSGTNSTVERIMDQAQVSVTLSNLGAIDDRRVLDTALDVCHTRLEMFRPGRPIRDFFSKSLMNFARDAVMTQEAVSIASGVTQGDDFSRIASSRMAYQQFVASIESQMESAEGFYAAAKRLTAAFEFCANPQTREMAQEFLTPVCYMIGAAYVLSQTHFKNALVLSSDLDDMVIWDRNVPEEDNTVVDDAAQVVMYLKRNDMPVVKSGLTRDYVARMVSRAREENQSFLSSQLQSVDIEEKQTMRRAVRSTLEGYAKKTAAVESVSELPYETRLRISKMEARSATGRNDAPLADLVTDFVMENIDNSDLNRMHSELNASYKSLPAQADKNHIRRANTQAMTRFIVDTLCVKAA